MVVKQRKHAWAGNSQNIHTYEHTYAHVYIHMSYITTLIDKACIIIYSFVLSIISKYTSSKLLMIFFDTWASCQIRKIAGAHAPGMPGTFSPSPQVSDPDMHHGTCVTHVPWCMPGSLTSGFPWNRRRGKTFPAFPAHAQPAILRIW